MSKVPFVWNTKWQGAPNGAFSAQLGDVTYYAVTRSYGHPAFVEARGMRGGLKRLVLGNYVKLVDPQAEIGASTRQVCSIAGEVRNRGG